MAYNLEQAVLKTIQEETKRLIDEEAERLIKEAQEKFASDMELVKTRVTIGVSAKIVQLYAQMKDEVVIRIPFDKFI